MVYRHCRKCKFILKLRALRLRKTSLISKRACFNIPSVTAVVSATVAAAVQKNGRFTTRDLVSALAYLIWSDLIRTIFYTDLGLEQYSSHKCRRRQELARRQRHPADPRPALFAKFCPRGLLPLPKGEGTAGWPLICPGEPQEDLWRGQQKCLRRDVRRRVPPLFWV